MRSTTAAAWHAPRNRWLNRSVLASAAVVAAAVYLPGLSSAFAAVPLDPAAAAIVLALALVPLAVVELHKARHRSKASRSCSRSCQESASALMTERAKRQRIESGKESR
jgi:heme A synthase